MKGKRARKKIAELKRQPIRQKSGEAEELKALARSWLELPAHDIIVCPSLKVVDGHRRLDGLELLGETEADVFITDEELDDKAILEVGLTTAIHRADLSGFEKWQACLRLLELNPGMQGNELAKLLHLDPSSITRLLSPSKCIAEAVAALEAGNVSISDIYAISKLPHEDQPALLQAKLNGASRDMLERQGRKTRKVKAAVVAPGDLTKRIKLPPVGKASVQVTAVEKAEISLEDALEAVQEAAKHIKAAIVVCRAKWHSG